MTGFRSFEPGRNPRSTRRPVRGFAPWEPGLGAVDAAGNVIADETAGMTVTPLVPQTPVDVPYATRLWDALHFESGLWSPRVQFSAGDPYLFFLAVERGLIPNTQAGFFTLVATMQNPSSASGNASWTQFVNDYLLSMQAVNPVLASLLAAEPTPTAAMLKYGTFPALPLMRDAMAGKTVALPIAAANLDASNAVWNPVTRIWIPKTDVLAYSELPDGTMQLQTKTGTWTWAGPNYKAPASAPQRTGKVAIQVVFNDKPDAPAGPPWIMYAYKQDEYQSDGSITRYPWQPRAEYADDATVQQEFAEAIKLGSTVRTLMYSQLDATQRAAIDADLTAYRNTPEYLTAIASAPPPIPFVPGATVRVPAPGTGGTTTIQLPGATAPIPLSQYTGPNYNNPATRQPAPGVPPVELVDGTLVAPPVFSMTNGAFGADDVTATPSGAPASAAPASAGFGGLLAIAAIIGIGLTMKRGRGR